MRRVWVVAAMLLAGVAGCDRGDHPDRLDRPAPLFTITDGTESIDLAKLRGKVVVLNLWATWCAPCVQELPSLLALQKVMPQLAVVGVSMDTEEGVYRQFLQKHDVTLTTVRDGDGRINSLYGTVQIPETYVIDRQGMLRRKFVSEQNWTSPEIEQYLGSL